VLERMPTGSWATTATLAVGSNPKSVDVAPNGRWLASPVEDHGGGLAVVHLEAGRPVDVTTHSIATESLRQRDHDVGPAHAEIGPRGRYVALNLANTHVGFARVVPGPDGRPRSVELVGAPVEAGTWIAMGRWSNDGRHYLVADTGWGPANTDAVFNGAGRIVAIRFDETGGHQVVDEAEVSASPESFDLDRSGTLLAVVNMERTYLPHGLPYALFGRRAAHSVSLVAFDPITGRLDTVDGPVRAEGVLPENAAFDRDGDALAVVVFHERSATSQTSWVQLWRVDRSKTAPRLQPTRHRIEVTRGGHDLLVVPPAARVSTR